MGRDNLVSELPGLNTFSSWEVVFTSVGLLHVVRTMHIDTLRIRTFVLHLCEHGIQSPG